MSNLNLSTYPSTTAGHLHMEFSAWLDEHSSAPLPAMPGDLTIKLSERDAQLFLGILGRLTLEEGGLHSTDEQDLVHGVGRQLAKGMLEGDNQEAPRYSVSDAQYLALSSVLCAISGRAMLQKAGLLGDLENHVWADGVEVTLAEDIDRDACRGLDVLEEIGNANR